MKAILVIDIPEGKILEDVYASVKVWNAHKSFDLISYQHDCPLRPLPPKSDGMHIPTIKNVVDREFCEGWDRYYEELTGEKE